MAFTSLIAEKLAVARCMCLTGSDIRRRTVECIKQHGQSVNDLFPYGNGPDRSFLSVVGGFLRREINTKCRFNRLDVGTPIEYK